MPYRKLSNNAAGILIVTVYMKRCFSGEFEEEANGL